MQFTLNPITPDHYRRMVEIINAQSREPATVDELLREDRVRPKGDPYFRLGAFSEAGELVGFGLAEGGSGRRPGEFWTRIRVDEPDRCQGIGTALHAQVVAFARANGATRLESSVREDYPESVAWAERRGFVTEHHLFESTRALADWDSAPFQGAVDEVLASGIRLTTLAAESKEGDRVAAIRRYYDFSVKLAADIPGHADRPAYPWEPYLQWVLDNPDWKEEMILLAADGERWVALCQLFRQPSGSLYNGFTAVDREYRGRNIALAIKVRSLDLARSAGAPYIRTNNHSTNQPMLAVNRKLGYLPLPGHYHIAAAI